MLLYHPLRKTYDDFDQVYHYTMIGDNGSHYKMETDKELKVGQIIILKHISDYAIVVTDIWEVNGEKFFNQNTAEEVIVRGRPYSPNREDNDEDE